MKIQTQAPLRTEIWKMFNQISPTYDRINRLMTFGLDQSWRKKLARFLPACQELKILDCATGTGDQIIALMGKNPQIHSIVGIDLAEEMIAIGKKKLETKPYHEKVTLQVASALELPFPDNAFDCVTISFGIRNVTDVMTALIEFKRVLRPNGRVLILEGTVPHLKGIKGLHLFYLRKVLPKAAGLLSKKPEAYRYLNQTIETFPQGKEFCALMRNAGFAQVKATPLFWGAVSIYQGDKNDVSTP